MDSINSSPTGLDSIQKEMQKVSSSGSDGVHAYVAIKDNALSVGTHKNRARLSQITYFLKTQFQNTTEINKNNIENKHKIIKSLTNISNKVEQKYESKGKISRIFDDIFIHSKKQVAEARSFINEQTLSDSNHQNLSSPAPPLGKEFEKIKTTLNAKSQEGAVQSDSNDNFVNNFTEKLNDRIHDDVMKELGTDKTAPKQGLIKQLKPLLKN